MDEFDGAMNGWARIKGGALVHLWRGGRRRSRMVDWTVIAESADNHLEWVDCHFHDISRCGQI